MGVGLDAPGDSIVVLNEQTTYATWEFLYDPRLEQLKAKGALNAGPGVAPAGGIGQNPVPFGTTPPGTTPTNPGTPPTPPGATPSSGANGPPF
jgi:hypothetical protein